MKHTFCRRDFLLYCAAFSLAACQRAPTFRYPKLPKNSRVLALGDSLTAGYGAPKGADYPTQLAKITGWRVINGGVSGDTSAQALARLPALMTPKPALVIISIGGNDFLRKIPGNQTRTNIRRMIEMVQNQNIPVVLVAIPYFTVSALLGFVREHPLYEDLAQEHRVPLLQGAWADVLGNDDLKSDRVHGNAAGYDYFANKMADFLKKQGFR